MRPNPSRLSVILAPGRVLGPACVLFLGSAAAAAAGPGIVMSTVQARDGQTAQVTATLSAGGGTVAGTQNDFSFDPVNIPVATKSATNQRPDCTVNPAINKGATSFAFQPARCSGTACVGVRVIVFATDNNDPIPNGSVLYRCNVHVSATAPSGAYHLAVSRAILSDPKGKRVCGTGSHDPPCKGNVDGTVKVGAAARHRR
jgi:hypothetical protein